MSPREDVREGRANWQISTVVEKKKAANSAVRITPILLAGYETLQHLSPASRNPKGTNSKMLLTKSGIEGSSGSRG
jgi:hypothetical protein